MPTNEAVMAARISTASRPSRKTMIAALVTTVVRLALSPSVPRAFSSSWSSASRVARRSRRDAPLEISSARPSWPLAPNQIRPSTSVARPGSIDFRRRSGPNSKNAYASSRACSAWRRWPAPTAASMRSSVSAIRS